MQRMSCVPMRRLSSRVTAGQSASSSAAVESMKAVTAVGIAFGLTALLLVFGQVMGAFGPIGGGETQWEVEEEADMPVKEDPREQQAAEKLREAAWDATKKDELLEQQLEWLKQEAEVEEEEMRGDGTILLSVEEDGLLKLGVMLSREYEVQLDVRSFVDRESGVRETDAKLRDVWGKIDLKDGEEERRTRIKTQYLTDKCGKERSFMLLRDVDEKEERGRETVGEGRGGGWGDSSPRHLGVMSWQSTLEDGREGHHTAAKRRTDADAGYADRAIDRFVQMKTACGLVWRRETEMSLGEEDLLDLPSGALIECPFFGPRFPLSIEYKKRKEKGPLKRTKLAWEWTRSHSGTMGGSLMYDSMISLLYQSVEAARTGETPPFSATWTLRIFSLNKGTGPWPGVFMQGLESMMRMTFLEFNDYCVRDV